MMLCFPPLAGKEDSSFGPFFPLMFPNTTNNTPPQRHAALDPFLKARDSVSRKASAVWLLRQRGPESYGQPRAPHF